MHDSVNSTITHNTLLSNQEDIENSYNGYKRGPGMHDHEISYNNKILNAFDYFATISNDIDSGYVFNYTSPNNIGNISNIIDGSDVSGRNIFDRPDVNPLINNGTIHHHTNGGAASNYTDDEDFSGNKNGSQSNFSDISGSIGDEGNSSSGLSLPIPILLPIDADNNSTDSNNPVDINPENRNTNSSSEDNIPDSEDIERPDVPDENNGNVQNYNYHPRNPSKNQDVTNSTKQYDSSNNDYSEEEKLSLLDILIGFVNSNTEGGEYNVSSYGGKTHLTNETYDGPSTDGEMSSVSNSKSSESSDSAKDASSDSNAGEATPNSDVGESSSQKAYKLDLTVKSIQNNTLLAIALIILCLIFLVVGYKRQNSD